MSFQDHGLSFHQVITDGGCDGGAGPATAAPPLTRGALRLGFRDHLVLR